MKYEYLLFDLDGTLVDTREGVFKSAQYALKSFNINVDLNQLNGFFGPPLKHSFTKLFKLNESQADQAIKIYLERYGQKGLEESLVFTEIPDILNKLAKSGYKMGVATSKFELHAIDTLKYHNINHFFDFITGANIDETISKKHEVIEESLKRFKISDKSTVLMIGDMKYDIIGAKKVGIDSLGIYTGTAEQNELENEGADYIVYSFKELEEKLLNEFI